jgi:hypothetical protein
MNYARADELFHGLTIRTHLRYYTLLYVAELPLLAAEEFFITIAAIQTGLQPTAYPLVLNKSFKAYSQYGIAFFLSYHAVNSV